MTSQITIRPLVPADERALAHVLGSSAWTSAHFMPDELPHLLATRPGAGVFAGESTGLLAFVLATSVVAPSAWLGGFGVPWQERQRAFAWLDAMLPAWLAELRARGVTTLYYSGHDRDNDWLRAALVERGFLPYVDLRSYDKDGTTSPAEGNQHIRVRACELDRDLPALLAIEATAFALPWRHDALEFRETVANYPFFIVAENQAGEVIGYQFNTVEDDLGFLVRIAVHPRWQGQGIGVRLMAEAMRYFAQAGARRVLLNAEEGNTSAHRLYEWFGFVQVPVHGFVLARSIDAD